MNSICTAYNKSEYTLAFISSRLVLFLSLSHFRIYVRHCHWMEHRSFLNSQCSVICLFVCVCKIQSRSTLQWNNSNYSEHVTMFNWTFMSILSHTTLYTTFHITGHVFSTRVYRMLNVYIFEFHSLNCVRIMSIFIYKLWISFWFRVCVCFFLLLHLRTRTNSHLSVDNFLLWHVHNFMRRSNQNEIGKNERKRNTNVAHGKIDSFVVWVYSIYCVCVGDEQEHESELLGNRTESRVRKWICIVWSLRFQLAKFVQC